MDLHVGCAMWTLGAWQGRQLPKVLATREKLRAYSSWCNAVEGNTTFYATPSADTARMWAEQVDPGFRFVLKLPRPVTHERRLANVDEIVRHFLTAIEPLGSRTHALWVQLPAGFSPGDVGVLATFLRRMPREFRHVVEVRHPAFFEDERAAQLLERMLGSFGAEWTEFDTTVLYAEPPASDAEREAWGRKPRLPRRMRALTQYPVVRYIGRDDPEATVAGWQPWVGTVAGWLREGRSPTMFIHTPDNAEALDLARRFHDQVREQVPELAALPEPMPAEPPTLF
jgi:uncharacterized protein YecE (DUF72 family)